MWHLGQGQSLLCLLVAAEEQLLPHGPLTLGAGSLDKVGSANWKVFCFASFWALGWLVLGRSLLGLGELLFISLPQEELQVPH